MDGRQMKIDVISDVVCPWCFLGKRRLDKALRLVPEVKIEVAFRPYFLDPSIPPDGLDRQVYMKEKFGNRDLTSLHKPLVEAGLRDDVPYHFDKITRSPNSLNAHRLIRWALQAGKQPEVVEALFCAYWRDGRDIGDNAVLAEIAGACGMDAAEVSRLLPTQTDSVAVMEEVEQAYKLGVQGVPTFILNQRYAVSGAQEVEVLFDAIQQIAAKA